MADNNKPKPNEDDPIPFGGGDGEPPKPPKPPKPED